VPYLFRAQAPQSWFARLLLTLAAVVLAVVGFFFLTAALVAGALIALVVGVRLWWTLRKIKRAPHGATANNSALDGEFKVVERESTATRLPPSNTPPAP
jgi:predicted lipid-binding transport protein (Tim44 family)